MQKTTEISTRLREFGAGKFASMAAFARAMEMRPQNLNQYLSGEHPIGPAVRERLVKLGCDVEWLMTGVSNKDHVPPVIDLVTIKVFDFPATQPRKPIREPVVELLHVENRGDITKYGVVVRGDKMTPELRDGEIVIASKVNKTKLRDFAIVTMTSGEMIIARVFPAEKQMVCVYENTSFPPRTIANADIQSIDRIIEKITRY